MDGEADGAKNTQEEQQDIQSEEQETQDAKSAEVQQQVAGDESFEAALAARDERIAALETRLADAARSAEQAEDLRRQINDLKTEAANEREEFALKMAGARNITAARALLAEHDGDVDALVQAEPWMFETKPTPRGQTGLPNAGAATDEGATLKRWRVLAGLTDEKE